MSPRPSQLIGEIADHGGDIDFAHLFVAVEVL
jgi:hypothetical protein